MSLLLSEREVIISFSAEDKTAEVYTSDPIYIRKLENLVEKYPDTYKRTNVMRSSTDHSVTSVSFECPIKLIRFGSPREYTEEQRKAMSERGKSLHIVK